MISGKMWSENTHNKCLLLKHKSIPQNMTERRQIFLNWQPLMFVDIVNIVLCFEFLVDNAPVEYLRLRL